MGKVRTKVIETAIEPEKIEEIKKLEQASPTQAKAEPIKKEPTKPPKQRSKRYQDLLSIIDKSKEYPAEEAIEIVKKTANTRFDQMVEAHVNLGISRNTKPVSAKVTLPYQTGKKTRILVFASKKVPELKKLGVSVGTEATLKEIEKGKVPYDKIIAEPVFMPKLALVAKVLGPKGLMPNPKSGTVSENPVEAVKEFSSGKFEARTEKVPIIHVTIGKSSFEPKKLLENLNALTQAINAARPPGLKKGLIRSIYLSTTMGPSVKVDPSSVTA